MNQVYQDKEFNDMETLFALFEASCKSELLSIVVHTFNLLLDENFRLEPSCDFDYWISLNRSNTVSKHESSLPGFTQFQKDMTAVLRISAMSSNSRIDKGHIIVKPADVNKVQSLIEELCKKDTYMLFE